MKNFWRMFFPCRMADGGEGGAEGEGTGSEDAGVKDRDAADQDGRPDGENPEGEQNRDAAGDAKARKAAWKQAIAENRDLYDAEVQGIIQKRLGKYKGMEAEMQQLSPALKMLEKKYGVTGAAEVARAIMNDDANYEEEAAARGMDVATYKEFRQTQMENESLRTQQEEATRREEAARQVTAWRQEEAELKKQFPAFDLDAEMEASDGELFRMLSSGVPLEHAYKVLHMDELMAGTIAGAVQRTQQRTLETIAARGARPVENGAGMSAERAGKYDISKLSRAKMEELERRSLRGETITPDKMFE